ncbi:MAG: hypothetical protein NC121_02535 [Blautia sp.]|nr:hypothetical protein [Blautia sp.]
MMKKLKKVLVMALVGVFALGSVLTVNAASFDAAWYAEENPDVVAAVGNSSAALKKHYDTYGRQEGRMANSNDMEAVLRRLFNAEDYAALYPDVKAVYGDNVEALFNHYMTYGLLERRVPTGAMSYEAAVALRDAVTASLDAAGVDATPGSKQFVELLQGSLVIKDTAVQSVVEQQIEKAVNQASEVVVAATSHDDDDDDVEEESGCSSSSASSSSSSSTSGSSNGDVTTSNPQG